jgi:PAS domain S-box-containing protein
MVIEGFEAIDELCATSAWRLQRARRAGDSAPVLLKLLQAEHPTPAQLARFHHEYALLRTLDIPGVAKPLAVVDDHGRPAMVLEDCAGCSLEALLGAHRLDLRTALGVASALAQTLAGLHAAGVVHHDTRPTNVVVDTDHAAVCLIDLGLATRDGDDDMSTLGDDDASGGDGAYRAPEQFDRVNGLVDARADLYALGVTLYRLFTGELPLHASGPHAWARCHQACMPRRPRELLPALPPAVDELVMRLLAKRPEDRGAGAHDVQVELERCRAAVAQSPAPMTAAPVDMLAVLKASQAISAELLLDPLLKTLLRTVIDSAGATTGLLFLVRGDELVCAAEGRVEAGQVEVSLHSGLPHEVPASILDQVRLTREAVVLADASVPNPFSADQNLRRRAAKSLLCLPIRRNGEVSGALYLENERIAHAFTTERLAALKLLAAQAAISLDNAQLYADLKLENWEAESELLERESHIRRLVDSNIIGVFFWDFSGSILDANDAFLEITGYDRADLEQGRIDWAALTPPEYVAADAQAVEQLKRTGTSLQYEKEYVHKNGQRVPVLVGGALLEGSHEMGIAFVLDLTERKLADAALRARQAADEANEAKSRFLANISHELRTPLNAILGYAQLLLNDPGRDDRTAAGLDTIRQSGELLLTLINDILDVAAIESGKLTLYPDAVDLPAFLRAVADIVRVKADQKNLALMLELAPDLVSIVQVDAKRLRQVLLNLLSNAVKFTDAGEVQLRVSPLAPPGETVCLRFEVMDSGIGIGPDQLATIFLPFVQAPGVQRRFGGSGLGLSISRQLLGLMGSELHVDSRVGRGSCFHFDLELPVDTRLTPAAGPRRRIAGYAGARRRILVVDDNAANRMTLVDMLTPLGFEVFAADNGRTGVELAETLHTDLILMDAVMPVMDGLDATRRLRALPQTQGVPIVIVSAGATPDDRHRSLAVGANAFLPKPLDMHRLLAEIGTLLALTWLPTGGDAPAEFSGDAQPLVVPPVDELKVLYEIARSGNMRRISERADYLASLSEAYRGFADELLQLAGRFESRAIVDMVAQHLQQALKR